MTPANEITLHPVQPKGKKRAHDEMDVESMLRDKPTVRDGFSSSPSEPPPPRRAQQREMVSDRKDVDVEGTAPPQREPRPSSEMVDAQPHAHHPDAKYIEPQEAARHDSAPLAGRTQQTPGPLDLDPRPTFPPLNQMAAPAWYPAPAPAPTQTDKQPSIRDLRSQILDNVKVLNPHMVSPNYHAAMQAVQNTEETGSIRIVTLKREHEWTAAWMFGFNHVILRSAGAGTAVGAMENLLECTSTLLLAALENDGCMRNMGP